MNFNTLDRMAAFEQSLDDEDMASDEKLSLACSGWLMGTNQAIRKLPVAASLFTTRAKVREYLEERIKPNRDEILQRLKSEEGATVEYVTHLLANMVPTRTLPAVNPQAPGYYELTLDGAMTNRR